MTNYVLLYTLMPIIYILRHSEISQTGSQTVHRVHTLFFVLDLLMQLQDSYKLKKIQWISTSGWWQDNDAMVTYSGHNYGWNLVICVCAKLHDMTHASMMMSYTQATAFSAVFPPVVWQAWCSQKTKPLKNVYSHIACTPYLNISYFVFCTHKIKKLCTQWEKLTMRSSCHYPMINPRLPLEKKLTVF